jgi:hypothetical protein
MWPLAVLHDNTFGVFAVYMLLIVVVIVNMMTACLCNTMQKVFNNVNVEWTYGRTAVDIYICT